MVFSFLKTIKFKGTSIIKSFLEGPKQRLFFGHIFLTM